MSPEVHRPLVVLLYIHTDAAIPSSNLLSQAHRVTTMVELGEIGREDRRPPVPPSGMWCSEVSLNRTAQVAIV